MTNSEINSEDLLQPLFSTVDKRYKRTDLENKKYYSKIGNTRHSLKKLDKMESLSGRVYHKRMDCVVCKKLNLRKQTSFCCNTCEVLLCFPEFEERTRASNDCFSKYHEFHFANYEQSESSEDDNSDDDFIFRKVVRNRI